MNFFRFFTDGKSPSTHSRAAAKPSNARGFHRHRPQLEVLEDRCLPSGYTISGFVFNDLNNNGLMDPGEQPLANASIELLNAQNTVIGTAISDANGYYQFTSDATVNPNAQTLTKTLTIPVTQTDFTLGGMVGQFDPSLGALQSVQIINAGTITSDIRVENTSTSSSSTINAVVSGNLLLTGPNNLTIQTNLSQNAGNFSASIFDGQLNFSGTSGNDFGNQSATGTQSQTITGSAMAPFIGTGNVQLTEAATATSTANGGGNLLVGVTSTATAQITVVYTYIADNSLKPGNYTVVKTNDPPGYFDGKDSRNGTVLNNPPGYSVIPLTLSTGNIPNNDFGELQPSSLSGYVYADTSSGGFNDGIKEPGEAGIAGVTVTLSGTNNAGTVNLVTTTDNSGFYSFANLQPGSYTLKETHPTGWIDGKDTAGTPGGVAGNDQITGINLPGGFTGVNNNFGEIQLSSLAGYVYADTSTGGFNDGIKEPGEAGIAGVTVTLSGTSITGAVNLVTTTDNNGFYSFASLQPGTYTLTETHPAGWIDGKDTAGTPGGVAGNDQITSISLPGAFAGVNNNFGELQLSSLSGFVYADTSPAGFNDGIKESGESGIAGVTVTLTGTSTAGAVNLTTTTDNNGFYSFANLQPGAYALTETHPAGWIDGKDTAGTPGGVAGNDQITGINLPASFTGLNNNFGELQQASLSGFVYADTSAGGFNDGIKESGEAGIGSVTITLTGTSNAGAVNVVTTTANNGFYNFANLQPGTYTLTETHPTGWIDGKDTIGTPGGVVGIDQFTSINLGASVNGTNNNFGEILLGQVAGTVYYDGSTQGYNDGIQDYGEPGIAGVVIHLTGTDTDGNAVNLSTTTNASGSYQFSQLAPGTYSVTDVQPLTYLPGINTLGTLGGQLANGGFAGIPMTVGGSGVSYNFGELLPSTISGFVYLDTSANGYNDGIKEPGEQGIANVTITLTGTNGLGAVTLTGTTDSTGFYSFTGLRVGTYTITETRPSGYIDGKDTIGAIPGQTGKDFFSNIALPPYTNDANNNFAVLTPVVEVEHSPPLPMNINPGPPVFATPPISIISKGQLLASTAGNVTAAVSSNARFINSLYTSILGRSADAAGLNGWLAYLNSGGTRQGLVSAIFNSAESRSRQVTALYQTFLGANPDPGSLNYYIGLLQNGTSELQVAAMIAGSPQVASLYPTPVEYVAKLFDAALGRTPSPAELAAWTAVQASPTTLALDVFMSQESLANIVQRSFQEILGRSASAPEVAARVAQLQSGPGGFDALINNLFTSTEYATEMGS